ncbi:MAG TPA: recombinase RecA [Myxococcales bacterium]|nr:recombinase RecA [Myxococcales bacterium]HAN32765.1 recombinase RecA [Myxococcales bacterium]
MGAKLSMNESRSLKGLVASLEKRLGQGIVMQFDEPQRFTEEVISTGSYALDRALGVGGLPLGRIVEIYGPEASGKTTLALSCIVSAQKVGHVAAFIDAEHALNMNYARQMGVDASRMLVSQPDCGEQALEVAEQLIRSDDVKLIVIDSVAALTPKAEIDGEMGDHNVGLHARLMSRAMRKLAGLAHKNSTTLVFINQLRHKIGVMFGSPETTTGGNALKFYASCRIDVRRIGSLKRSTKVIGNRVRMKVVKNKMAAPFQVVEVELHFGHGFRRAAEVLEAACIAEVVSRKGSYFHFADQTLGQGRDSSALKLEENPDLMRQVEAAISALHAQRIEA